MSLNDDLFQLLWQDYLTMTPQAKRVSDLLQSRGESIVNDHIALRTFAHERVDIEVLDRAFVEAGYEPIESYEFKEKKLVACHYEHENRERPKVFISSLLLDECSAALRDTVATLLDQVPPGLEADWRFAVSGRRWELTHSVYLSLLEESAYAAWLAAFGFRANHFTVAAHKLKTVDSLTALNTILKDEGFALNESGGTIKGSEAVGLEQSSTIAESIPVGFQDGSFDIPSCYYEFAYRHVLASGELFEGFIADSATHLFDSTNVQ
jgi:hypothetical protein